MPLKFDIASTNFDNYFAIQSAEMSEGQKETLPKELGYKLFNRKSIDGSKLSFFEKIFVLIRALRKRVIILIEDDVNGMDEQQYFKYKKLLKKRETTIPNANEMVSDVTFVLANKEVIDTYAAMNLLCASAAYNYATKAKNSKNSQTQEAITQHNYLAKIMTFYESNRKRLSSHTGLSMAEWLVLIYIFHGREVESSFIYKEWYKYSCNSSSAKIKTAFSSLQSKGYAEKIGVSRYAKLKITPLGRIKTLECMTKYVLNC